MSTNGIGVDMQNIRRFVAVVGVGALVLGAGCGSSDDGSLYDPGAGGSSAAAGSGTAGTGGSSTGGSSTGGSSTGGTAGSSASGGSGGGGGSAAGAGGVGGVGGSATGGSGGSGTGGGGGIPGSGAVNCGGPICDVTAGQQCCVLRNEAPKCFDPGQERCDCGIVCEEIVVACDGPEDCESGEVCCDEDVVAGAHHLVCLADCTRTLTTPRREICHPNVSGGCSSGSCTAANDLPAGYGFCQ